MPVKNLFSDSCKIDSNFGVNVGSFKVIKQDYDESFLSLNAIIVTTFYKFTNLSNLELLRDKILQFCNDSKILGTILLGTEGINSTISGTRSAIDKFYIFLDSFEFFSEMEYKESFCQSYPFKKMKVKIKKEIVTFGACGEKIEPGLYIPPEEWDEFILRDDVVLLDTRNDYEYEIGTFKNAINPNIATFKEFAEWFKQNIHGTGKKVAMFCTGGIRCEKSTSFAKDLGLGEVYHLKGGIIGYFIKTKNKNGMWKGKCYVFDDRVVVDELMKA
jgi:UPF0176 protein